MELTGLDKWSFTVFEYGERWRTHRKLFHEFFNVATVSRYDEDQRKAASRLLKNLSEHPSDFHDHIQLVTGSLALSITYNIQVDSAENPYFHAAEKALEIIQPALVPGAFPVEFLPFREYSSCHLQRDHRFNPLHSSPFPVVAPRWRFSQLRGTRLQILDGQHHAANAIRCRTAKSMLDLCVCRHDA